LLSYRVKKLNELSLEFQSFIDFLGVFECC
jgi:hypothetical protein